MVSLEKVPRDSIACGELSVLAQGAAAIRLANNKALSIAKYLRLLAFDKRLKLIHMGIKATAAEAVAEVEAAAQSGEIKRLATEFMALSGSALTVSLAQEPNPGTRCAHNGTRIACSLSRSSARPPAQKFRRPAARRTPPNRRRSMPRWPPPQPPPQARPPRL